MLNGARVCEERESHNLRQQDLAELVGIKQPVISKIERNKHKRVSLLVAARIAWALRCTLDELLNWSFVSKTNEAERKEPPGS